MALDLDASTNRLLEAALDPVASRNPFAEAGASRDASKNRVIVETTENSNIYKCILISCSVQSDL